MNVRTKNLYKRRHLFSLMGGGVEKVVKQHTVPKPDRLHHDIENLEAEYGGGQTLAEEQLSIGQRL